METTTLNAFTVLAEAFCYPGPGQVEILEGGLAGLPAGSGKKALEKFVKKVRGLTPGEWEELHTRTLDLDPPAAPYVGFQTWGESYQRGVFLAKMNRELAEAGIDMDGELADHMIPVLRYLGQAAQPLPELIEVLAPAARRMAGALRTADPANPYIGLYEAAEELAKGLSKEAKR